MLSVLSKLIVSIAIACAIPTTVYANETTTESGVDYLNQLRTVVGLVPLQPNAILQKSALNHANYLLLHKQQGHGEVSTLPGFTGVTAAERAIHLDYPSRQVSENVSTHSNEKATPIHSIDSLFSAIYHRFGFLTFDHDEIGIGSANDGKIHNYVYNMGNSRVVRLCSGEPFTGFGRFYHQICADENFRIDAAALDAAQLQTRSNNREIVVWPSPGSSNISPVFYEEDPDPLPDYSVSGYPISIQFNPAYFDEAPPKLTRFELFLLRGREQISKVRLLHHFNDPNQKLTPLEFALFPLERLHWATQYKVEIDYERDDSLHLLEWEFATQDLGMPVYVIHKDGEYFSAESGKPFAVYIPPANKNDDNSNVNWRYSGLSSLQIEAIDGNTLKVLATGSGRAKVKFHNMQFEVVL